VVTGYNGEPRLCEVAGTDPERGTRVGGLVECQGRREGDRITVWVFGWPRTGTIEDPVNSIAMGSIVGGVGVFIFTMALAAHHRIRRRLGQQPLPA
jgi:hypothetical protein